jgi:hypothetical protein
LQESDNTIDQDILESQITDSALWTTESKAEKDSLYNFWEYGSHVEKQYRVFVDVCRLKIMKD